MSMKLNESFSFYGRVLPDHVPLSVDYKPKFMRVPSTQDEPACIIEVGISHGKCEITVELETYTDRRAMALFQAAWDAAQRLADTAGFIDAVPYTVVIDGIQKADGSEFPLALGDPHLRNLNSFSRADTEAIADLLINDFAFGQAMSDLVGILSKPHIAAVNYGRIAESIARLIAPSTKPNAMWTKTRQKLRVSEAFLRKLTDVSTDPRHGNRTPVGAADNRELSEMAWRLMNRYVHYRLRESDFSEQSFPELTI